jgi:hypothetical protein
MVNSARQQSIKDIPGNKAKSVNFEEEEYQTGSEWIRSFK